MLQVGDKVLINYVDMTDVAWSGGIGYFKSATDYMADGKIYTISTVGVNELGGYIVKEIEKKWWWPSKCITKIPNKEERIKNIIKMKI